MPQIAEDKRLPADIDAQPPVQAAAALRSVIRGYHDEIERAQRLPKALVEQFHAAGFYRLVRPRELGGLQADPLTYLRVVELLAEAAGSVGWNLCNNNIAQLVTLGLPDEGVHEIYGQGGDTAVAGTAVQGGGRALPAQAWVGPHHSAVITGIARAGIDALIELAGEKTPRGRTGRLGESPQVQEAVGRADAILNAGRVYRSATITELWNTVAAGEDTTIEQRARCRLAAVYAADSAREAMDLMYRHGGSTSYRRESRLAECWRDLHVVGQAVTLAPEWYPMGGRVFLKMDPGPRLR